MFVGSGLGNGLHKSLGLYRDFFGLLHLDKVNFLQFLLCFLKIYCIFVGDMAYLLLLSLKHFREAKKDIRPEAIAKVYHRFRGVTLYLQRIMKDAFAMTPEGQTSDVDLIEQLILYFKDKILQVFVHFQSYNRYPILKI